MDEFLIELKKMAMESLEGYDEDDPHHYKLIKDGIEKATTYPEVMKSFSEYWKETDAWWIVHNTIMKLRDESEELYNTITWPDYS